MYKGDFGSLPGSAERASERDNKGSGGKNQKGEQQNALDRDLLTMGGGRKAPAGMSKAAWEANERCWDREQPRRPTASKP